MAQTPGRLWTTGRKIVANLLPMVPPFLVFVGVLSIWPREGLSPRTLSLFAVFPIVSWVSVNVLGLTGNRSIRLEMERRLDRMGPGNAPPRMFVGFASPRYSSALDPHEEVGWLTLTPDRLTFIGDASTIELPRAAVSGVRSQANIHSTMRLGGWVAVSAVLDGSEIEMLFEPRERSTLSANRTLGKALETQLRDWQATGGLPGWAVPRAVE